MAKKTTAQIEFKAVTSEFSSGIKQMNSSINTLNNELKLNSTQLKGNEKDVGLLQQRQAILQREYEASSQKVELTSRSLEEAKRILGENSREYQNLNNALIRAQTQQQAIQNEINQTANRLNNLDENLDDAEQGALSFGEALKASIGGNLIADGIQGITSSISGLVGEFKGLAVESDYSFSSLAAQTGVTGKELEELESIMNSIYANNLGEGFDDIANSMAQVYQQTGLTGDALQQATEGALILKDTFGFEVNESVRSANMLMQQFGLSSTEAYNLIAQGAQAGLDKNGDLLDTINEYSVHFNQAGYTAEEMFNSLQNGANAGTFSVDKLGDAVKEFGIRMKDGSANEALKSIGLNVNDVTKRFAQGGETASIAMGDVIEALYSVKDPLKQNEAGVALMGTMWEDLGADGVNALMNIHGEASRSKDTLNQINEVKYDNIGSALQGIGRNIKVGALEPIQDKLLPVLNDLANNGDVSTFADGVKGAMDGIASGLSFIVENKDVFLALAAGITAAAGAYTIMTGVVAAYNFIMPIYTAVTSGAALSTTALGGAIAFLTSPITIAALAIGALIGVGVLLWQNWDTVSSYASSIWEGIKTTILGFVEGAKSKFTEFTIFLSNCWTGLTTTMSSVWTTISNVVQTGIMLIGSIISGAITIITLPWQFIWQNCKDFLIALWDGIKSTISSGITFLGTCIQTGLNFIKNLWTSIWNGIKAFITPIWDGIKSVITNVSESIYTAVSSKFELVKSRVTSIFNAIKNVASSVWNGMKSIVSGVCEGIYSSVSSKFNLVKSTIDKVINGAKTIVSTGLNAIKGFFDKLKLKFPNVKLPHFSIKGSFSFNPPSVPKLGVEWYAKGGIMTNPTIFGMNGSRAMVGGEAGPEAILPLNNFYNYLDRKIGEINNSSINIDYDKLADTIVTAVKNLGINLDGNKVGSILDKNSGEKIYLSERGLNV